MTSPNVIQSTILDSRYWMYCCAILGVIYVGILVCYRIYLSPLARFPGPRLAAATGLYEAYYQIVKGGTFTWHIDDLHQKYGPIIRIKPNEIHIKDPTYYNTLYAGPGKHRNKDNWFSSISFPQSLFSTSDHGLHRARRRVLAQFFKKKEISQMQSLIWANFQRLSDHFSSSSKQNQPVELHAAFECFTCDTISQYAFGTEDGFHYLEEATISSVWKTRITSMFELCRLVRHFSYLGNMARWFPSISMMVCPKYQHAYEFERVSRVSTITILCSCR